MQGKPLEARAISTVYGRAKYLIHLEPNMQEKADTER